MTIGSPSGSGATQGDIADGVAQSTADNISFINASLSTSKPRSIRSEVGGAAPTFEEGGVQISSGTSEDYGGLRTVGASIDGSNGADTSGALFIKVRYASGVSIANLSDEHGFGLISLSVTPGSTSDSASFRPFVGDNTSGNIRVDNAGTDNDGSISYPTLTNVNNYGLLVDFDGVFLSAGTTGFYVNGDPRRGDSPTAEIAAVVNESFRRAGLAYSSNGSGDTMYANHIEVVRFV